MRVNRLQFLKKALRKTSASFLIIGLLITTYSTYINSSNSNVFAEYFTPSCTTDGTATGPRLQKVEFAGGTTSDQRNTIIKIRNCSTTKDFIVTVEKYSAKCDNIANNTCAQAGAPQIEQKTIHKDDYANGGSYEYFNSEIAAATCGSTQTDIILKSYASTDGTVSGTYTNVSAGTYYKSPNGACAQKTPTPAQKTVILGRVWTSNVPNETWQSVNVCPANSNIKTSAGLNLSGYQIDKCDATGPYFHTGEIDSGNKTLTLTNTPHGYTCGSWNYSIYNRTTNQWEGKGSGNGCSITANFSTLASPYDNGHHLAFYLIKNTITPAPTATAVPTPVLIPSPTPATPTPTIIPTPNITARPTPVATMAATPIPILTPVPTVVSTPSPTPVITPTPSPSPTPTNSPSPSQTPSPNTQLKLCKYEDDNANGVINSNENVLSWTFNLGYDGLDHKVESNWWHSWTQGCAIVDVPSNKTISVSEQQKSGWRQTALYSDGARTDTQNTYTYTSDKDSVKVLWFLNTFTPATSSTPTATPTPTLTPIPTIVATPSPTPIITPTSTPTATSIPVTNSNYNVSIEKRVDGTRIDGDKVGIQYRIKIKNNDSKTINNFRINDTLPETFTYDANTTEGDITTNPDIQDVAGDDNRRLVWTISSLEPGKEINFGYRTTGKKDDKNYCNDASITKNDNKLATSQACVRINQSGQTQVLGTTTTRTLPATGEKGILLIGLSFLGLSVLGWKLSKHIE